MKKLVFVLIGIILFTFIGCNKNIAADKKTLTKNITGDEKIAAEYVKSQGYEITAYKGEVKKYVLEKSMLYGSTESIPYQQAWGVQKVEPNKYFGKEITIYGFTVKNHPLQTIYEDSKDAKVNIMLSEGNVIGGYSYPNSNIDGKTLSEVTGLSFKQWSEDWKKKYGN